MVLDKAKLSELIHKKIDVRACGADHRCQGLLRYSGKSVQLALSPLPCEQKKSAGESLLAALRNLVDEILLELNIARKQIRQEAVGERMVGVERSDHLVSFNDFQSRGRHRGGGPHANILTAKARFTKKIAWPQNGDNCHLVSLGGHRESHAASLNVHERLGDIALRENSSSCCKAF